MNSTNKIIFDYLTFTIHDDEMSPEDIINWLGLDDLNFQKIKGFYGYLDRYFYDGIHIHFNGRYDMGICVELSGQGCRNFETYGTGDFYDIFEYITTNKNVNVTRLDVAYDDFEKLLDLELLLEEVRNGNYVTKFRTVKTEISYENKQENGTTLYFGSNQSQIRFRIYDKKAERKREDIPHWVRFEQQLRDDRAACFIALLYSNRDVNELFFEVLNNYLRFVKPSETDTNLSRSETAEHWLLFLESKDKVVLTLPGSDYNVSNLVNYVCQNLSGVAAFVDLFGYDTLSFLLQSKYYAGLSEKHKGVLKEFGVDEKASLFVI